MPNHRLLATTDDHSSEEDDAGHGSSTKDFGLSVVILALAFGLLAKALPVQAKQNLDRAKWGWILWVVFLPYTVLILLWGLVFGFMQVVSLSSSSTPPAY